MRLLLAFLLIVIVTAFTCRKTEPGEDQYTTFYYSQTQCADPWRSGATDSLTLVNVSAYLAAQGLYVASLQIKHDGIASVCLACQCKTGKTIYVTTFNNDVTKAKYLEIGFQQ